jgi:hypothetical protein
MRNALPSKLLAVLPALLLGMSVAYAQSQPTSKIVCWKDKSGRVIGCGDKVPPEYQDSATKELNRRGVTVKQSDAALTAEQRQAQQAEAERKQAAELKRAEQQRQDRALLDTFSNEREIDLKRSRDVQLIESNIETLQTNLKNADERQADARARIAQYKKRNAAVPGPVQDDFDNSEAQKIKIQNQIVQKRREITMLNQRYDELKKRFIELKSGATAQADRTPPAPATSAQPGTGAPARK